MEGCIPPRWLGKCQTRCLFIRLSICSRQSFQQIGLGTIFYININPSIRLQQKWICSIYQFSIWKLMPRTQLFRFVITFHSEQYEYRWIAILMEFSQIRIASRSNSHPRRSITGAILPAAPPPNQVKLNPAWKLT